MISVQSKAWPSRPQPFVRRYNAGHPLLPATISHSDTGKMREEGRRGGGGGERGREINQRSNPLPSSNSGGIPIREVSSTSWSKKKTTTVQIFYGLKHRFMLSSGYNNNDAHKKNTEHTLQTFLINSHWVEVSTGTAAHCEAEGDDLLREQTMKR